MFLVLCDRRDTSALWAFLGLRRRGVAPALLLTADDLAGAIRWDHRLGAGRPSLSVELRDGRTFSDADVRGVLNRLVTAPAPAASVSPADADYAAQELHAFYASWLASLGDRVVNRPTPHGLAGPLLAPIEWLPLASAAGLRTVPVALSTRAAAPSSERGTPRTVLVVGGEVVTEAPPAVAAGAARLADLAGCRLLGVEFLVDGDRWRFQNATPTPDLSLGGDRLLERLAALLCTARQGAP